LTFEIQSGSTAIKSKA